MVTRVEERVSKGSATPTKFCGAQPQHPQILAPSYKSTHSTRNKFWTVIKLDVRKIFTGPTLAKIFGETNADSQHSHRLLNHL